MLVKVIKETTRTVIEQVAFVIEAESEEQAKALVESSSTSGAYSETSTTSPTLTYATTIDTKNWAKLEVRQNNTGETHIVYSLSVEAEDIQQAIVEQVQHVVRAHSYREGSIYLEHRTGTCSATITILQEPSEDNSKLLANTRLIMARHKARDELKKLAKLDVSHDQDYAEFVQSIDRQ